LTFITLNTFSNKHFKIFLENPHTPRTAFHNQPHRKENNSFCELLKLLSHEIDVLNETLKATEHDKYENIAGLV
jgi:hypothetical protein